MKMINPKQRKILQSFIGYRSPIDEESLYKGIDINYLPLFKKHFRGMFIYRPRGGRYHIPVSYTHLTLPTILRV